MQERGRTKEQVIITKARSLPGLDGPIIMKGLIIARLTNERTGQVREVQTHNLITAAGDVHYAERATTKTPTNAFALMQLTTQATPAVAKDFVHGDIAAYIAGSSAVVATGYPANADTDGDNSGSSDSVVSWRFAYTKASFASGVVGGVVTTTGPTSGSAALTQFFFGTTFAKTTDDTLVIFVNHTFLGTT